MVGFFGAVTRLVDPGALRKAVEDSVPPASRDLFTFHWDKRPIGQRMARLYAKDAVYPAEGFRRVKDVDLEKVK